jgi:hypothetical protein
MSSEDVPHEIIDNIVSQLRPGLSPDFKKGPLTELAALMPSAEKRAQILHNASAEPPAVSAVSTPSANRNLSSYQSSQNHTPSHHESELNANVLSNDMADLTAEIKALAAAKKADRLRMEAYGSKINELAKTHEHFVQTTAQSLSSMSAAILKQGRDTERVLAAALKILSLITQQQDEKVALPAASPIEEVRISNPVPNVILLGEEEDAIPLPTYPGAVDKGKEREAPAEEFDMSNLWARYNR